MTEQQKQFLDEMSDELLLLWLNINYGENQPIWKRCSKKEYEKHVGPTQHKKYKDWTALDMEKMVATICNLYNYKAVPIYKDAKPGLLGQIELMGKEPDYYKYYKKAGTKRVILVCSEIMEYLDKRGFNWRNLKH